MNVFKPMSSDENAQRVSVDQEIIINYSLLYRRKAETPHRNVCLLPRTKYLHALVIS